MFLKTLTKLMLIGVAAVQLSAVSLWANAADIYTPKGVVEVFTSQGCSSCPPADKFVTSISNDRDVLALAFHVDYWDYLGWKDTFAKSSHTDRQRAYSRSFNENQVYTPQAVINGRSHTVGSRANIISATLDQYGSTNMGLSVPINATIKDDAIEVSIDAATKAKKATLWMVYFNDKELVKVERGENRGRDLTYSNIVRDVELVGMVEPSGMKLMLPFKEVGKKGHDSCALILQETTDKGTPGPIIGATVIRDLQH